MFVRLFKKEQNDFFSKVFLRNGNSFLICRGLLDEILMIL